MICPTCGHDNLPGNEVCSNCEQALTPLDLPAPTDKVERALMENPVASLRPKPPITVHPTATVQEVIQIMLDRNIGAVLVVDEQDRLLGIFSERDLLKKIAGLHDDFTSLMVGTFMTPDPVTVTPRDPLNFALHRMDIGGYRHMPVVEKGKPIGVISVRDMLRHITAQCQERR